MKNIHIHVHRGSARTPDSLPMDNFTDLQAWRSAVLKLDPNARFNTIAGTLIAMDRGGEDGELGLWKHRTKTGWAYRSGTRDAGGTPQFRTAVNKAFAPRRNVGKHGKATIREQPSPAGGKEYYADFPNGRVEGPFFSIEQLKARVKDAAQTPEDLEEIIDDLQTTIREGVAMKIPESQLAAYRQRLALAKRDLQQRRSKRRDAAKGDLWFVELKYGRPTPQVHRHEVIAFNEAEAKRIAIGESRHVSVEFIKATRMKELGEQRRKAAAARRLGDAAKDIAIPNYIKQRAERMKPKPTPEQIEAYARTLSWPTPELERAWQATKVGAKAGDANTLPPEAITYIQSAQAILKREPSIAGAAEARSAIAALRGAKPGSPLSARQESALFDLYDFVHLND